MQESGQPVTVVTLVPRNHQVNSKTPVGVLPHDPQLKENTQVISTHGHPHFPLRLNTRSQRTAQAGWPGLPGAPSQGVPGFTLCWPATLPPNHHRPLQKELLYLP